MDFFTLLTIFCVLMVSSASAQTCGNGICETGETVASCPADCQSATCNGNGICNPGEDSISCPTDCANSTCNGNSICEPGETAANCPSDCSPINCNRDGICETGEDAENCPTDCSGGSFCGNLKCEAGETAATCPIDCGSGTSFCGNGLCENGETTTNCPQDCLSSTTASTSSGFCGDGLCQNGETSSNCPSDCSSCGDGVCESPETPATCPVDCSSGICGNGVCDPSESFLTCPGDCPNPCGNGICDNGETVSSCPQDCSTTSTGGSTSTSTSSTTSSSTSGSTSTTGVFTTGGAGTTGTSGTTGTTGTTGTGGSTGCISRCSGKVCGPDSCGGYCGFCMTGQYCANNGTLCLYGTLVTGFVYDSSTKAKVANASCTLSNSSPNSYFATTNGNGQYTFTDVKPDIYVLKCVGSKYLSASIQVLVEVSTTEQTLPSLYLILNPCLTSPPCSGNGTCDSDGETCICNTGAGEYDCSGSLLAPICVPYRGIFNESFTDSVLIRSAINKALVRLNNLLSDLNTVKTTLPEYMANSCCFDPTNHTTIATNPNYFEYTRYPLDLRSMAAISYTFSNELVDYNTNNDDFLMSVQALIGGK